MGKAHRGSPASGRVKNTRMPEADAPSQVNSRANFKTISGLTYPSKVDKREENVGLEVEWRVAMLPGSRRRLEPGSEEALDKRAKASVKAKVEHPFLRLKRLFGYGKVRYRGLAKNVERLALLFGLGNLLTAEGQLAA